MIEYGAIGVVVGFLISFWGFVRSRDKEVKKEATETAVTNTKLDHIGSGVNSIQVDMKVSDRRITELSEQIIRTDESAKSAHKRIDKINKECVK